MTKKNMDLRTRFQQNFTISDMDLKYVKLGHVTSALTKTPLVKDYIRLRCLPEIKQKSNLFYLLNNNINECRNMSNLNMSKLKKNVISKKIVNNHKIYMRDIKANIYPVKIANH